MTKKAKRRKIPFPPGPWDNRMFLDESIVGTNGAPVLSAALDHGYYGECSVDVTFNHAARPVLLHAPLLYELALSVEAAGGDVPAEIASKATELLDAIEGGIDWLEVEGSPEEQAERAERERVRAEKCAAADLLALDPVLRGDPPKSGTYLKFRRHDWPNDRLCLVRGVVRVDWPPQKVGDDWLHWMADLVDAAEEDRPGSLFTITSAEWARYRWALNPQNT